MNQIADNLYIKLYSPCIPVKGASRSVICDLDRSNVILINQPIYEILTRHQGLTIGEIKEYFGSENAEVIDSYMEFLVDQECVFFCEESELDNFPEVNKDLEFPSLIANSIIDMDQDSDFDFADIVTQLDEMGCKDLLVRIFYEIADQDVDQLLNSLSLTCIENTEVILKYQDKYEDLTVLRSLAEKHKRIGSLVVYNSPQERQEQLTMGTSVVFTTQELSPETHCGAISPLTFHYDVHFYLETLKHNNCLNRKISVDTRGTIKNCPSMKEDYGNVRDTKLTQVLENEQFRSLWNISKDTVDKCKDCEFRYICSDCRAFTEQGDLHGKPLNCAYDPYTAQWEELVV